MQRGLLFGLMAATGVCAGSAFAADDTGAWYVSPMAQYSVLDKDRISEDDFGYQVGVGKNFAPNWAAELNFNNASFGIPGSGASQRLTGYSLDFTRKFFPASVVHPYLLVGAGEIEDVIGGSIKRHSVLGEAGLGLLTGLGPQTGSARLQLRTEAKYRREFASPGLYGPRNPSDVIFGVGLQFMFGAPLPMPAPAVPVVREVPVAREVPVVPEVPVAPAVLDSDGDGVIDSMDKCPNTPKGDRVDSVGCTLKDEIKLQGVNFATDSAELVAESDTVLGYAVATLKKYPALVIEVHGHTDNRGPAKHNVLLSQRRAQSVMKYLREHGVTNPMTAKGYGKSHPIADNSTAAGRLENRRVSLKIEGGS